MLRNIKCIHFQIIRRCYKKKINTNTTEMKYLNVAEKNDAAKTIACQLSNGMARRREGYSVYNKIYEFETNVKGVNSKMVMTSVSGHLLHLEFLSSYRNWQNVDPQVLFDAPVRKACSEQLEPIKKTLEREVRGCQGLIVWTDCDREGENIGFEIIDVCRAVKPNIAVYRAIFSEITAASVKRALENLASPDKLQSQAVDVRTELDLRTGAAITRFQTMRLQRLFPEKISSKLISYGSCQIPTLGFVAERYKEIEAFVSEPFWKIKVTHTIGDLTVDFLWTRNRLFDKQECEDYYMLCISNPMATVEDVSVKPKSKWRPTPMDTVELEKLGSRKLKLSAKEVMTIAEKLYTKGIISYPRTETNMFSKDINLRSLVEQQSSHGIWGSFAERVMAWGPNPRNGTKSDQAHPPIHPTKMVPNLEGNEGRVYELICRHFLACVSKDAVGSETIVTIKIEGEKFTANGLVIFERNYLDVYLYEKWNSKQIHKYEQGQVFEPTEITMPEGSTTAPPLLTEADLITLMEKHGIGTDATHAEHINTIKERGYIGVVDKGCLVPGVIGMGLYEGYDAMELALAKPELRAEFEVDLKKICLGEKDPNAVLKEQIDKYKKSYKQIMDKITAMDDKMSQRIQEVPQDISGTNSNVAESGIANNRVRIQEMFKCPKCNAAPLALKQKNNKCGYFIGCLNFPNCKHCIWFPDECKDPSVLDEYCSKCGSEYKLLKFKFALPYHKSLFNSPNGWYKTCLRCDSQFRNTFNINTESVKRTGPIVSDNVDAHINYTRIPSSLAAPPTSKSKKDLTTTKKTTESKTAVAKTTKTKKIENHIIRSYYTLASQSSAQAVTTLLHNAQFSEFFDSSDGFDDLILAAESSIPPSALIRNQHSPTTSILHQPADTVLSADLAAMFNDDEDFFADIQSSSTSCSVSDANSTCNIQSQSATRSSSKSNSYIDDSFSAIFQDENDFGDDYAWGSAAKNASTLQNGPSIKKPRVEEARGSNGNSVYNQQEENYVKCTGCCMPAKELSVKKEGPNTGRIFYVCSKSNACNFFQWANEVSPNQKLISPTIYVQNRVTVVESRDTLGSNETDAPNCNCNRAAKNLTVRKEGPNKGREFYACANRDKSCGFFQWTEENENYEWGKGTSTSSKIKLSRVQSKKGTSTTASTAGRKCGLCRQEGHSRQKCPRKADFDY